jgi:hypothetical protein
VNVIVIVCAVVVYFAHVAVIFCLVFAFTDVFDVGATVTYVVLQIDALNFHATFDTARVPIELPYGIAPLFAPFATVFPFVAASYIVTVGSALLIVVVILHVFAL